MKNATESTNGQIIGGDYFQAVLLQPSGNQYGNSRCFLTVPEAVTWAKECRRQSLEQIGGKPSPTPWKLRITGCPDLDIE